MGFDTEGFLGFDALHLVDEQRATFPDLFTFAYDCSTTAMKSASLPISTNKRGVLANIMLARCIAQFQGAIILAERGLSIESMLLTRALYETVFVLGALAANKVTLEELADSDFGNRRKMGNALLPIAKNSSPPEHYAKLTAFVAEHVEANTISINDMATKGGMKEIYDGIYRHLSHFAAHPSVTATGEYYAEQTGGYGQCHFRPLTNHTPKALLAACSGITLACGVFEKFAQMNPEINSEINTRLDREEVLYQKYRPWDV
jgi:hypothetical protein